MEMELSQGNHCVYLCKGHKESSLSTQYFIDSDHWSDVDTGHKETLFSYFYFLQMLKRCNEEVT